MELVLWHVGGVTLHRLYWTVRCGGKRAMGGMAYGWHGDGWHGVWVAWLLFVFCVDFITGKIYKLQQLLINTNFIIIIIIITASSNSSSISSTFSSSISTKTDS